MHLATVTVLLNDARLTLKTGMDPKQQTPVKERDYWVHLPDTHLPSPYTSHCHELYVRLQSTTAKNAVLIA